MLRVKADPDGHSLRSVVGSHRQYQEQTQPGIGGAISMFPVRSFDVVQEDHEQQSGGHAQHHVGPGPVSNRGGKETSQGNHQHDPHRHSQGKRDSPSGQGTVFQHKDHAEQGGHAGKGAVRNRLDHRPDLTAKI